MATKILGYYRPHDRVQKAPGGPSMTKQAHKDEVNINRIMARYEKTGLIAHVNTYHGNYSDFLGAPDYHAALSQLRKAEDMFLSIPSGVRAKFENDPEKFLAFVQDPANAEELVELGLAHPQPGPVVETQPEHPSPAPESPPEAPPAE